VADSVVQVSELTKVFKAPVLGFGAFRRN